MAYNEECGVQRQDKMERPSPRYGFGKTVSGEGSRISGLDEEEEGAQEGGQVPEFTDENDRAVGRTASWLLEDDRATRAGFVMEVSYG